jgi:hypothetical protein
MARKPFEIAAECTMPGFPTGADVTRVSEQIETARRARPDVVRATVNPPAIYRDRSYVLQTKFIVWADDASRALQAAKDLLADTGLPCRAVLPSSRALLEGEAAPPPVPAPPGRSKAAGRRRTAKRGSRTSTVKARPRTVKRKARGRTQSR